MYVKGAPEVLFAKSTLSSAEQKNGSTSSRTLAKKVNVY